VSFRHEDPTGRVALFLGRLPHAYILGMEEADSEALLDPLWAHACQPKYSWKNEWQKGDLIAWDRNLLHCSDNFSAGGMKQKTALVLFLNRDE